MSNEQQIELLKEKRKKINNVSCSFCTAKWLQTTLYLQTGYNHSCHHPSPHKIPIEEIEKDPAALHNSQYKKEQRLKMIQGDRPAECDYCWKIEDLDKNYFSDRHYKTSDYWAWDRFEEIAKSDPADNVNPSYLEVSFSNACNFACAYCSPEISSKWMEDIKKNGPYPTGNGLHKQVYRHNDKNPYVDAFWKWFPTIVKDLRVLRITGGEPTMSKDTWRLLDYLIENPQKFEVAINTNLGVPDELIDRLIQKINQLAELGMKVDVYTSAEATGNQQNYARDGMDYAGWMQNIARVLSETKSTVAIMTTINLLSLPSFVDFIKDVMNLRKLFNTSFETNRIPLSVNYLRWPQHLQCTLLDIDTRKQYADKIETFCETFLKYHTDEKYARLYLEEWDQIKRFCDYLRTEQVATHQRYNFIRYIQEYDKRRNKNFATTFPDFAHLLEEWNA
jgi:organic radical activating enzyme